jgi:hypothetical protein
MVDRYGTANSVGVRVCHGPVESVHDFRRFLKGEFDSDSNHGPKVSELIALQDRAHPPPLLIYGDLSSLNILIRGDKIVGIIGWEIAGWYAIYWEYVIASQVKPDEIFLARGGSANS